MNRNLIAACGLLAACGILAVGLGGCAGTSATPSAERAVEQPAWRDLFDGTTLTGWTRRGGAAEFRAQDGCIVGLTRPNQPNSFLCTDAAFGDFELELDFLVDPKLNSGVQIRSEFKREGKSEKVFGYQVEIDPSSRAWTAGLYDEGRRGWLVNLDKNPAAKAAFKQGQWNHLRVKAQGDFIQTWLNDVSAAELHDGMTLRGFIGLQVHAVANGSPELCVKWKNLRLRELK